MFLLEEFSMKILLDGLLTRLCPGLRFLCVPHEGKQDLEKSLPRKLRVWKEPGVRFVVVRDNDDGDCHARKRDLVTLCRKGRREDALVRIACQALEAWYLGEPDALAEAFGDESLRGIGQKARFRNPDAVSQPALALERLVPAFQKVSGARRMARHLTRDRNRSRSFHALMAGIDRLRARQRAADARKSRRFSESGGH
ncbi:MAG: DUF4276 family protein [Planctomycetota bacterium]